MSSTDFWFSGFDYREVAGWPKLSWIARCTLEDPLVEVFHGPHVEVAPEWFAEAVWAGDFENGDFDQISVVVGTGIRLRNGGLQCVTSSDMLNGLYYYQADDCLYVANSLPVLLAVADVSLVDDFDYGAAMQSVIDGLDYYQRSIPVGEGEVQILYFENLRIDSGGVNRIRKPELAPDFDSFAIYREYLASNMRQIIRNAACPSRKHAVSTCTTVSSGYDSAAVSVLARECGVEKGFTVTRARRQARNLFDMNDSGMAIARHLNIDCKGYSREDVRFAHEVAGWAAMGQPGDLNLCMFEYSGPVSLLFAGFFGGNIWGLGKGHSEFLSRTDSSGARFSEGRLHCGVFICSPVFWGCEKRKQVIALAHAAEMSPWRLGTSYDRPVPRRILEEAGLPRDSFARSKKAASFNRPYRKPFSAELQEDFAAFLKKRGKNYGSWLSERVAYVFTGLDFYIFNRLPERMRFSTVAWSGVPSATDFFLWANSRLKEHYYAKLSEFSGQ